jgi:hypothetical protein
MFQSRDPGIQHIRARAGQRCYGMGLGIILLDDVYPGFYVQPAIGASCPSNHKSKPGRGHPGCTCPAIK